MSGSGNDFVVVDATREPADAADRARDGAGDLCPRNGNRGGRNGAPGAVRAADFRMRYLNSDGSPADLCGNASLCSSRLASELGILSAGGHFTMETDAGILAVQITDAGPEVDLQPVRDVRVDMGHFGCSRRALDRLRARRRAASGGAG